MNHFWCLILVLAFVFIFCKYTEKKDCGCGKPMIERAYTVDGKIEKIKTANPNEFFEFLSSKETGNHSPEEILNSGNPFIGKMKNHNDIQNGTYVKLREGLYEPPK